MKHILRDSTGRGRLEAYAWFPPDLTPRTLPSAEFALYPVTVMNLTCEYSCLFIIIVVSIIILW